MKTVTLEQFRKFNPCWNADRLMEVAERRHGDAWTAIDVLELPTDVCGDEDKLWAVLREEFIPAPILHEFACRCAERALSRIPNPDPRSIAAIAAKRAWIRGEINEKSLRKARNAALDAAALDAAMDIAQYATEAAARSAAWEAAQASAWSAARDAAWASERSWQVAEITKMLDDGYGQDE